MSSELALFEHRLAATLRAGIALPQALAIAGDGLSARLGGAVRDLERRVRGGSSFAAALAEHPEAFGELDVAVAGIGEETGLLPENLERLAAWGERAAASFRALWLRLLYPAILLLAAIVIPPLPLLVTRSLSAYARGVARTAVPLALAIGGVAAAVALLRRGAPALWSRVRFGVPFLGVHLKKLAVARFGESLALLYASGVEVRRALHVAARSAADPALERAARRIAHVVERGGSLAEGFASSGAFSPALVAAVDVGERTGELDRALGAFASLAREEAEQAIRVLLIVLPVVVYLLVALYVAVIVVSAFGSYFRTLGSF